MKFESWGRYPRVSHKGVLVPESLDGVGREVGSVDSLILPRGMGRSYGDSCLNEDGYLLSTRLLDKFIHFNSDSGILRCETGVTLDEILRVFVPKGWFLQVTPGTKYVTVGGAIANDVHGKNHHKAGAFGNHVVRFEIERSDGTRTICSRERDAGLFRATIGGLGLTGIVLWAEIKLRLINGPYIEMESIKFESLNEFFQISHESEKDEYTVSWLDCLHYEDIRGIFMRGNHIDRPENDEKKIVHAGPSWKTIPFDLPASVLSRPTIKLFNYCYYNMQRQKYQKKTLHYDPFFYPLDNLKDWNRMYGERGFLQWQCVVPSSGENTKAISRILSEIVKSGLGSFLVVLKEFGSIASEGIMSFPMPGTTLAVDFPNTGKRLLDLLERLDYIIVECGGRIYPAKDARMSKTTFLSSFPEFNKFKEYIDPKLSSSLYRRIL